MLKSYWFHFYQCADSMRSILIAQHLPYKVLETDPAALLRATRHFVSENGALGTRCTVQYNLFAGSVVFLGNDEQKEALYASQRDGELGCFAFTEKGAGVLTGKGVETEALYDSVSETFLLNSPSESSTKYWISQGLYAEHAVILAELIVNGNERKGPHLFYTRIQKRSKKRGGKVSLEPLRGVEITSLPVKTAFRGLDNAFLKFDNFSISKSALLDKFCTLRPNGDYTLNLPSGTSRMLDVLITRLLTGRICLSEYAVHHSIALMRESYLYASTRMLWMGIREKKQRLEKGEDFSEQESEKYMMINRPLVYANIVDYSRSLAIVADYIALTREEVAACILKGHIPQSLVESVCICKFTGTSLGVDATSVLRKIMGAHALLEESHLGSTSFVSNLTCAAEGDDTIMEMKVVGDIIKGGLSNILPYGLIWRSLFGRDSRWLRKRLLWVYIRKVVQLFLVGKKHVLDEGQLMKDISWARAHLVILDRFLSIPMNRIANPEISSCVCFSGKDDRKCSKILCGKWAYLTATDVSNESSVIDWVASYERVMVRFPTPPQH